jgi:hypothetical protein
MDLGQHASNKATSNYPELPNTMFIIVICRVANGNDIVLSPNQLQATYTDVRHWEELIDVINKNGQPKAPYTLTSRFKCTLQKDELNKEYTGLYQHGHMIPDSIHCQILYNCCVSNVFKLKLGHDRKIVLVETNGATG